MASSVWVEITVPEKLAKYLAFPGGEPAEKLHVTLLYIGKVVEMRPDALNALSYAVKQVAKNTPPFNLMLEGIGTFPNVIFAPVVMTKELGDLQGYLNNYLTVLDLGMKKGDKFIPHVTLAKGHVSGLIIPPVSAIFVVEELTVRYGNEKKSYKLEGHID